MHQAGAVGASGAEADLACSAHCGTVALAAGRVQGELNGADWVVAAMVHWQRRLKVIKVGQSDSYPEVQLIFLLNIAFTIPRKSVQQEKGLLQAVL